MQAGVFYIIFYWVYKVLLTKFYCRTTAFNEDLPLHSIFYIKAGILMHGMFSLYIFSNSDLLHSKEESEFHAELELLRESHFFGRIWSRFHYKSFALIYLLFWAGLILIYLS